MSARWGWRLGSPLLAAVGAVALGLAVVAVPGSGAVAASSGGVVQGRDSRVMYDISVRALSGAGGVVAQRLDGLGFDVTARSGSVVHVLGGVDTIGRLGRVGGVVVVGRRPAAPAGPVAAAPASQDSILPRKLHGNMYQTYYGGYRTVAAYDKFESDLAAAYPGLVQKVTYGSSFTGDNSLNAVCITADASKSCQLSPDVHKARFLVMSQIHAREIATSEMSWRYMTRLVDGWKRDAQITSLLKSTEIWVVPEVNPDGIVTVQNGITQHGTGEDSPAWQRKNEDAEQAPAGGCTGEWAFSQTGVDLNRNNDSHWGGQGTSEDPCDQQYLGTAAGSESETVALAGLFDELFRDQRGPGGQADRPGQHHGHDAVAALRRGSRPDAMELRQHRAGAERRAAALAGLPAELLQRLHRRAVGRRPLQRVGYVGRLDATTSWASPRSPGSWTGPGACTGFLPAYSCMDAYEANNLPGLFYDAAAARTPYKLSFGPTVLSATATLARAKVTVTASADDDAYGTERHGSTAPRRT